MNLGTENRNKVIAAVALGLLAVVLMATRFSGVFSLSSSSAAPPAPATLADNAPRSAPTLGPGAARKGNAGKKSTSVSSLDPTLRTDLLGLSEETKYQGTGRNIFKIFVEPPPKVVVPPVEPQHTNVPSTPPPPPINLKFYGFATPEGGIKRIFLAQGEDVFIAKEGDIVDRRYKVVRISANAVEILDVLSNNRQSIPLTQG